MKGGQTGGQEFYPLQTATMDIKREGCTSNPPGSNDKERKKKLAIPRMQKRVLIAESADIQRIIQEYYKFHTHKFDNLE